MAKKCPKINTGQLELLGLINRLIDSKGPAKIWGKLWHLRGEILSLAGDFGGAEASFTVAMDNAKKEFNHFRYFESAFDACNNTNAIIIGTEWNEFRALNFSEISKIVKTKKVFDLRNIYNSNELEKLGFAYYGTGK